jgi:hypothetical protein
MVPYRDDAFRRHVDSRTIAKVKPTHEKPIYGMEIALRLNMPPFSEQLKVVK